MTSTVVSVGPEASIEDIARTLLRHEISAVPVVDDNGTVVGMVSEGDLMRRPESDTYRPASWWLRLLSSSEERATEYVKSHGRRAKDVMTQPVVTVGEDATLAEVADILERRRIKRVPVVRDGKLIGIVSRANLLHGLVTAKETQTVTVDDRTLRQQILNALSNEAGVQDQLINVTVSDGTVHLWGTLLSEVERDAVRLVARNTPGVRAIDDRLGVVPPEARSVLWAE